jgi:putative oxidoreductase
MKALTTVVARVLFALPYGIFGLFHLSAGGKMAAMVPIPGGVFWIYFTGVAMLAGCIGLITKIQGKWAALGLALLTLLYTIFIHLPGLSDPAQQQLQMAQVLKNIALIGGALTWAGIFMRQEAAG